MRVFIGWSEEPSRFIAKVLHDWLQGVVQRAEPWMSDNNIDGGSRWNDRIAKALEETDFALSASLVRTSRLPGSRPSSRRRVGPPPRGIAGGRRSSTAFQARSAD